MNTNPKMNTPIQPRSVPAAARIPGHRTLAVLTASALLVTALPRASAANILDNDPEHRFMPTLSLTHHASESAVVDRSGPTDIYGKQPNPTRITATIVGNLAHFAFTEIAEDMPVALRIGDFGFEATLGDDAARTKNPDGTLRPFDPRKSSATFLLRAPAPPAVPGGAPRLRTVGSVKVGWNLQRVVFRVQLSDVAAAGADAILPTEEEQYPQTSTGVTFSGEKVPVEVTFGTATGSRFSYARGKLSTAVRKLGTVAQGNRTDVALHSLAVVGEADCKAPTLVTTIPAVDEAPMGVISFNGTIADGTVRPLTSPVDPLALIVTVDGVEMTGGTEETDAFGLYITDPDAKGRRVFSVLRLPVAAREPKLVTVSVCAKDASGNLSPLMKKQVQVRSVVPATSVATTF